MTDKVEMGGYEELMAYFPTIKKRVSMLALVSSGRLKPGIKISRGTFNLAKVREYIMKGESPTHDRSDLYRHSLD